MRNRTFAVAAAIVILTAMPSMAQAQLTPCGDQTIKGTYLFTVHGKALTPTTPPAVVLWIDGVGTIKFDGNGGFTQQDFIVQNAVPPDNQSTNGFGVGETGTYAVFPDCTGHAQIIAEPSVLNLALVISPAAGTIHAVVSSATRDGSPILVQTYSDFERIGSQNTQ